jgi:hypothetical protein
MGIRTDFLVTEEITESSDLRATPFEFERAKRVETALSILEGKWKIGRVREKWEKYLRGPEPNRKGKKS